MCPKFSPVDHNALASLAAQARNREASVLISNSGTSETKALYKAYGFTVDEVQATRRVNSKGADRGPVTEYLIY